MTNIRQKRQGKIKLPRVTQTTSDTDKPNRLYYDVGGIVKRGADSIALAITAANTGETIGYVCSEGLSIWFVPIRRSDIMPGIPGVTSCPSPNKLIDYMFDYGYDRAIVKKSPYENCMTNIVFEIWSKCLATSFLTGSDIIEQQRTHIRRNDLKNFIHYVINNITTEIASNTMYSVDPDDGENYLAGRDLTPVYAKMHVSEEKMHIIDIVSSEYTFSCPVASEVMPYDVNPENIVIRTWNDYYLYEDKLTDHIVAENSDVSFAVGSMILTTTRRRI